MTYIKRRELLGLGVAAGVALTGCLGDGDSESSNDPVVSVSETRYNPRNLSVAVETTVTWVNDNSTIIPQHTVRSKPFLEESADWNFDEELSEEGDEVSYTFETEGLYTYVDTDKGEDCMCGLIAVGDVSYDDPLPCSPVVGGGC